MKFIYLLFLIAVELFASMMSEAVSLYQHENYIQAYERFYLLHVKHKEDRLVTLYLAKSLYNLGEYEEAEKILLSLYEKEKTDNEVKFFLAKVLYEEKQYKKAKEMFAKIKNTPYEVQSKEYVAKIDEMTASHKYFFLVSLGMTYDDNIRNNTFEPTTTHGSLILSNDTYAVSDTFFEKMLYAMHKYKIPGHAALSWDDTILLYHRNGLKYTDQNMFYSSLSSGLNIRKNGFVLEPKILLSDLRYASKHYMYSYGVGIKMSNYIVTNVLQVGLNIVLKKEKFVQKEDKTKDDNIVFCKVKLLHTMTTNDIFQYSVAFQKFRKEFGNRVDISRNEQIYEFQYRRKLPIESMLTLQTKYEKRKFTEDDVSLGNREDTRRFYTGSLSKRFQKVYDISLKYVYLNNSSSISAYSYKKSTVNLALSRYF